jgi:hypothetical protein
MAWNLLHRLCCPVHHQSHNWHGVRKLVRGIGKVTSDVGGKRRTMLDKMSCRDTCWMRADRTWQFGVADGWYWERSRSSSDTRLKNHRPCAVAEICEGQNRFHIQAECSLCYPKLKSTGHFGGRIWDPVDEFAGDCEGRLRESRSGQAIDDGLALKCDMGQMENHHQMKNLRQNRMKLW